ncbi:hypothetical protein DS487_16700 [Salmonella enterica subsp. enterica]|nr:hypothetical protein [Salmonella enterica subsp. enterica serovar Hvittingfoss]
MWPEGRTEKVVTDSAPRVEGYFDPLPVAVLLQSERRSQWLRTLWEYSTLPKERFDRYFLPPLQGVVGLCQRLPASEQGKFACVDGLVDYTLQTTVYAVRLSKGYMLPRGASAEEQSAQSVSWSAVIYYAALFHALETLWNIEGELYSGKLWRPGLNIPAEPYRFRFKSGTDVVGARLFGESLAVRFLPEPVMYWLGQTPEILRALLAFLSGRYNEAQDITDIVNEAIMHAGGVPLNSVLIMPEAPVADVPAPLTPATELSSGLRQHAPWEAPVILPASGDNQEVAALASSLDSAAEPGEPVARPPEPQDPDVLQVISMLGTHAISQPPSEELRNGDVAGVAEGGPPPLQEREPGPQDDVRSLSHQEENAGSLKDSALNPAVPLFSSSELGTLFWTWLRDGLNNGNIPVNLSDASVHLTCGFIFISVPNIFFNFLSSSSEFSEISKEQIQVAFERLGKYRISGAQRFWTCHLYEGSGWQGRYRRLSGYLIRMSVIYPAGSFPSDSLFLKVIK